MYVCMYVCIYYLYVALLTVHQTGKGTQAMAQTGGLCSEDEASAYGTPTLSTELSGSPEVWQFWSYVCVAFQPDLSLSG